MAKKTSIGVAKIPALFLCLAVVIMGLAGCGGSKQLSFSDFEPDSRGFTFPKTEWGMTAAETEKALGFSLTNSGEGTKDDDGNLQAFFDGKETTFLGLEGRSIFQFKNDRLWAAGIEFQVKDGSGNKKLEEWLKTAREKYGPESETLENKEFPGSAGYTTSSYTWEKLSAGGNTTKFRLSCTMKDGGVTSISVDTLLWPIPEEY